MDGDVNKLIKNRFSGFIKKNKLKRVKRKALLLILISVIVFLVVKALIVTFYAALILAVLIATFILYRKIKKN
ncbi:hypothetical protein PCIT_a2783 [Pseudoalteromonas citrea]|uniref:Uncharacterized protein n=2 Tax=Pseudoalteromonas citrea TaxID=43655 RepID=A0AAD4FRG4_9GAMM|nr:hypothetical protein PCIT_a2783 [Pseudoalteromonas citrea]